MASLIAGSILLVATVLVVLMTIEPGASYFANTRPRLVTFITSLGLALSALTFLTLKPPARALFAQSTS